MAQINRLKDSEISNGNVIDADDLDAEFDQLVNGHNDVDSRLDDVENNALTIAGQKTFTSNIKVDGIDENSSGVGVTIDGVVLKDSTAKVSTASDPSSPADGTVWYNSADDELKFRQDGSTVTVATQSYVTNNATIPKGYISPASARPVYASSSTLTIASFYCKSSDNADTIDITSSKTVNIANSGLNGRATNYTEGTSEWIYLYAIKDSLSATPTPGYLLSTADVSSGGSISAGLPYDESGALTGTVSTTIGIATVTGSGTTFLSDYVAGQTISITGGDDLVVQSVDSDTQITATSNATAAVSGAAHERWSPYNKYRQLPFAIRNDSSGNFIPWVISEGWPYRPVVMFNIASTYFNGSTTVVGATNVLNAGTATTFTNVDCTSFQPPISSEVLLTARKTADFLGTLRRDGESHNGSIEVGSAASANAAIGLIRVPTASRIVEYRRWFGSGDLSLDVMGWVVTNSF